MFIVRELNCNETLHIINKEQLIGMIHTTQERYQTSRNITKLKEDIEFQER